MFGEKQTVSQVYTSSFDGPVEVDYNTGVYKAAQNQGAAFNEEGLKDVTFHKTKKGVSKALDNF